MRRLAISPRTYRRITFLALVMVSVIIVSGAGVRVTGSGLGCPDWPTCTEDSLVAPVSYHALVEFVNRVFTGVLSVTVIVLVLGSLWRAPRRRDLVWLSLGVAFGIPVQIVIGGLSVLWELVPPIVMAHFLASIPIVACAVVLHRRAGIPDAELAAAAVAPANPGVRDLAIAANLLVAAASVVLFTGTVVTGSGPHGGDPDVKRFDIAVPEVARVHGLAVWLLLALTLGTLWLARRNDVAPSAPFQRALRLLVYVIVGQGAIGYTQYFTGVPAGLVLLHVAGSVTVWLAVLNVRLAIGKGAKAVGVDAAGARAPSVLSPT
ncbi:MAG: heme A synthase [Acidimicrobiia bacterium]